MKGIEMMLANMIGVTPDKLRETIEGFSNAATQGVEKLQSLEEKIDSVLAWQKEFENVRCEKDSEKD